MLWLTVDPGLRGCGYAWWYGQELLIAGFAPAPGDDTGPPAWVRNALAVASTAPPDEPVVLVVVETMRVYKNGRSDPADLLQLQGVSSAVSTHFHALHGCRVEGVEASKWKGQVPRKIMGARVEKQVQALGWSSRVLAPKNQSQLNDVHHAVGLGLYSWGVKLITQLPTETRT